MTDQRDETETQSPAAGDPAEDHSERRIWWTIAAIGFVVFIAVLVLGRPLVQGRLSAARNLDRATAMIAGVSGDLAIMDEAVRASAATGTDAAADGADAPASAQDARRTLEEAAALSVTGYDRLTTDEQERAMLVKATAMTRLAVLDAADAFVSAGGLGAKGNDRGQALDDYEAAVEKMQQADAALAKQ